MSQDLSNAQKLHLQGNLNLAESAYRDILKINPDNSSALNLLGLIFYQTGRYKDAINLISRAIKISPNFYLYHNNLGKVLSSLNQFEACLLYTSPSPRDRTRSRMPSSA